MALNITKVETVTFPALRFIGKRCLCHPNDFAARWCEWFDNGWFEQIGKLGVAPENGDAYIGATLYDGIYRIGLFFPPDTPAPNGFEYADIPASRYAVFGLNGRKEGELFGEEGITLVLEELHKRGWTEVNDGSGLARYACRPQSATSAKKVNVLFEFLISID